MAEIESKLSKLSKPPSSSEDSNDFLRPYVNLPNHPNSLVNGSRTLHDKNGDGGIQIQGKFIRFLQTTFDSIYKVTSNAHQR